MKLKLETMPEASSSLSSSEGENTTEAFERRLNFPDIVGFRVYKIEQDCVKEKCLPVPKKHTDDGTGNICDPFSAH